MINLGLNFIVKWKINLPLWAQTTCYIFVLHIKITTSPYIFFFRVYLPHKDIKLSEEGPFFILFIIVSLGLCLHNAWHNNYISIFKKSMDENDPLLSLWF